MKIALLGYGAMGRLLETLAHAAGDEIVLQTTTRDVAGTDWTARLRSCDVALDFSQAAAVLPNVMACAQAGVPLVLGTTGWQADLDTVRAIIEEQGGALVYGANFSLGVNLFYRIVAHAAGLFAQVTGYEPFLEEAHHSRKKDAPSGTALKLQAIIRENLQREFSVVSTRAGHIPGTHRVGFDAAADQILLTHEARSREGFAAGALLAARWLPGRSGVYVFTQVIDEIIAGQSKEH